MEVGYIVPIPKPNKDIDKGTSYRTISLLSVITNTLEKYTEKYRSLYNSVPTDENELNSLRDVIDSNNTEQIYITPDIIRICIGKLKAGKDDGDIGFKSDHIINGTHRLFVLLALLYTLMFNHGHTPADLLKSAIVSIPKDNKKSISGSDNYRGISLLIRSVNYLTILFYLNTVNSLNRLTCNLAIRRVIQQHYVRLFIRK